MWLALYAHTFLCAYGTLAVDPLFIKEVVVDTNKEWWRALGYSIKQVWNGFCRWWERNWQTVLAWAQIIIGVALIAVGIFTGGSSAVMGVSMLAGGVISLIGNASVTQIAGGVGSITNGVGAIRSGASIVGCWPIGTII